jgi:hypothetical protein
MFPVRSYKSAQILMMKMQMVSNFLPSDMADSWRRFICQPMATCVLKQSSFKVFMKYIIA